MRIPSSRKRLTYQDLLGLPEDRLRHELIDGKHLMSPAPILKHQRIVFNLSLILGIYLRDHPLGRVYGAPVDVLLSEFDVVEPDLVYISTERERRLDAGRYLSGAPELVVEVLSPSTAKIDTGRKLRLYDRYGVDEYWIVDPAKETLRVYRRATGRLRLAAALIHGKGDEGQAFSTPLLPGLTILLATVFDGKP
jgi:Uma2 family endonuclease